MTQDETLKWVQIVNSILALGVPITKLIITLRGLLTDDQVRAILVQVKQGFLEARQENDARIAELSAQIGEG